MCCYGQRQSLQSCSINRMNECASLKRLGPDVSPYSLSCGISQKCSEYERMAVKGSSFGARNRTLYLGRNHRCLGLSTISTMMPCWLGWSRGAFRAMARRTSSMCVMDSSNTMHLTAGVMYSWRISWSVNTLRLLYVPHLRVMCVTLSAIMKLKCVFFSQNRLTLPSREVLWRMARSGYREHTEQEVASSPHAEWSSILKAFPERKCKQLARNDERLCARVIWRLFESHCIKGPRKGL